MNQKPLKILATTHTPSSHGLTGGSKSKIKQQNTGFPVSTGNDGEQLKILAIETSTEAFSVALAIEDEIMEHFAIAPMQHAELLLPNIEDLLTEAGITLNALDAIAVSIGPGSFTGVRLGVSAAQGLAFGANLPVIPVSTLATLAQGAYEELASKTTRNTTIGVLPALDARMHEIYWAVYELNQGQIMQPLIADCLIKPNKLILPADFTTNSWIITGNGWQIYQEQLQNACKEFYDQEKSLKINKLQKTSRNFIKSNLLNSFELYPRAKYVAKLAKHYLANKNALPATEVTPVYLRDPV